MITWFIKRIGLILFLMHVLMCGAIFAQEASEDISASDLLAKAVKSFEDVQDFIVTVTTEVKMERFQVPSMNGTMYFKKPDKIHFSSQNFFLVPREAATLNPAVLWERYDASFVGMDTLEGKLLSKIQLAAKEKKTRLRQLYIWIDSTNWTIIKAETVPYEGRTLSMVFSYERQQEKYWLPSRLIVTFGSMAENEKSSDDLKPQQTDQFEQMYRRAPRRGYMTILYSNYKVNTGLDDAIFEKKEK